MKAIRREHARLFLVGLGLASAACVPAPEPTPAPTAASTQAPVEQRPAPAPVQTPSPAPTPALAAPVPLPANWIDQTRTVGSWIYEPVNGGTIARYVETSGSPLFSIGCMTNSRRVVLIRHEVGDPGPTLLTIYTETATRTLRAKPAIEGTDVSHAAAANDPLLDAIALTRGRFAVETPENPTLYLPAWAEVTRVIEDCR